MVKLNEKREKIRPITFYIAVAVFAETAINAIFSAVFHEFIRVFYSDYAHLTVWGDIVAIVSVIVSFIIYDTFAHMAYKELKSRLMFLGIVYVASKAASIIHYLMAIIAEILTQNAGETAKLAAAVIIGILEIAVDVAAAIWLMGYFDKKLNK